MNFHVITIFPDAFDSYLKESIIGRAIKNKKIKIKFYNPRDYVKAKDWYKQVDDRPYGGGPGMVMQAEPILKAVSAATRKFSRSSEGSQPDARKSSRRLKVIIFSPSGKKFTNEYAKNLAKKYTDVVLISGRYEGIDARVKKILKAEDISIGDYVLTGGELPTMVLIDSTARQIEGVLHKKESLEESRISSSEVYTRPEILKYPFNSAQGKKQKIYRVPKVLLSGHRAKIEEWKKRRK